MKKTSRKDQAAQTRQNIIRSTAELLKKHSLQDLQIKQICAHAGTSIGNFYHHFPNKHSILITILDEKSSRFLKKAATVSGDSPGERIADIFRVFCENIEELGPELTLEIFAYNIISKDNFLLDSERPLYRYLLKEICELQKTQKPLSPAAPEEITRNVLIVFRGFLYEWCLSGGNFTLQKIIREQIQHYLSLYFA